MKKLLRRTEGFRSDLQPQSGGSRGFGGVPMSNVAGPTSVGKRSFQSVTTTASEVSLPVRNETVGMVTCCLLRRSPEGARGTLDIPLSVDHYRTESRNGSSDKQTNKQKEQKELRALVTYIDTYVCTEKHINGNSNGGNRVGNSFSLRRICYETRASPPPPHSSLWYSSPILYSSFL